MDNCIYRDNKTQIIGICIFIISFLITKYLFYTKKEKEIITSKNITTEQYQQMESNEAFLEEKDFFLK